MAPMVNSSGPSDISPELARALGGLAQPDESSNIHPDLMDQEEHIDLSEDEETLQLQLQQIALQKRELELKLKMRRLQRARRSSHTPRMSTDANDQSFMSDMNSSTTIGAPLPHANPLGDQQSPDDSPPQKQHLRDSRSKSKVEEAKRRTEERQERMLKDLERRSRRRENLTAEWVQVSYDDPTVLVRPTMIRLTRSIQSRDVWAKGPEKMLVNLMHQHSTYAYNQNSLDTFEAIFQALYQLVDHNDWYPPVHDDLLRERTRRKMSQLRSKMVKSGEIISRGEGYGGWTKADDNLPDGLSLDQQDIQHDLHAMATLPLDMDLGDAGEQPSEEALIARNAMMHTPHDQNMLQHQSFQHSHSQHAQAYPHDMQDFGQHSADHMSAQRAMHESDLSRQNTMGM